MSAEKDREPIPAVSTPAAVPTGAVFLSYASEDATAAERIATALRDGGIEVWFDKSEPAGRRCAQAAKKIQPALATKLISDDAIIRAALVCPY